MNDIVFEVLKMPRTYPEFPIPSVSAIIIKGKKILLVKRKNEPGKGLWSIPGGVIKPGEDIISALKRECLEETNLICEPICLFDVFQLIIKDEQGIKYHYIIFDFLVEAEGEAKAGSDAEAVQWFDIGEVLNAKLTRTTRKIIEEVLKIWKEEEKIICKQRPPLILFEIELSS